MVVDPREEVGLAYLASPNDGDLVFLKELIEAGKLSPVIDRTHPLHQTAEGFFYSPSLFCETADGIPSAKPRLYETMGHPAGSCIS